MPDYMDFAGIRPKVEYAGAIIESNARVGTEEHKCPCPKREQLSLSDQFFILIGII